MNTAQIDPIVSKAAGIAAVALSRRWRHLTLDEGDYAQEAILRALNGSLGKPSDGSAPTLPWMVGRMISRLNRWAAEWGQDPTAANHPYDDQRGDDSIGGTVTHTPTPARESQTPCLTDPRSDHEAVADLRDLIETRCPEFLPELGLLIAGHTQASAAQELGISPAAFEKRVARARRKAAQESCP